MSNKDVRPMDAAQRNLRFRAYFKVSLLAMAVVLVVGFFYACQVSSAGKLDPKDVDLIQFRLPADDATVAIFETTEGSFKAVIYEDQVPNFTKYFKELVGEQYYDDTYVFAVQKDVYFMGGSKADDGTNTDDTDTKKIEPELSADLWPFKGALVSYGDKGGTIFSRKIMSGSRILFVNSVEFTQEFMDELDSAGGNEELVEAFKEKGGVPNFSQQYTVFGQVYDGMEVYDKICGAEVKDEKSLKPKKEIKIKSVKLSTYGENRNDGFFTLSEQDSSSKSE
ncbi:MAG: peptidylprolyl isomerase [Ruminococcus sp.]|nr:peptidylprolyl isomerase [Ruminococcus sp.]